MSHSLATLPPSHLLRSKWRVVFFSVCLAREEARGLVGLFASGLLRGVRCEVRDVRACVDCCSGLWYGGWSDKDIARGRRCEMGSEYGVWWADLRGCACAMRFKDWLSEEVEIALIHGQHSNPTALQAPQARLRPAHLIRSPSHGFVSNTPAPLPSPPAPSQARPASPSLSPHSPPP